MNNPFVTIIIANFNGERYLSTCLTSVLKSTYKNFEIIIVDDGSTDNSLQIVKIFQEKNFKISVIKNKTNQGAAFSRNKAAKKAKGKILVFLDNDTEVDRDWLWGLIKPLKDHKKIAASQSLLLDFQKRNLVQMGGGVFIPHTVWLLPFYQGYKYKEICNKLQEKEIIAVSAALAVKSKVFKKIGGFDEKAAIYTEDLDFSWRIWILGYHVILSPKSIVYHHTKTVEQRVNMEANRFHIYYHLSKNALRSIIKNYQIKNVIINIFFFVLLNIARGLLVLVRRLDFTALAGATAGVIWNLVYLEDTLRKRRMVQKTRRISDQYLSSRIFSKISIFEIYNQYFRKTKLLW